MHATIGTVPRFLGWPHSNAKILIYLSNKMYGNDNSIKLQSAFWKFQTITASDCCLIKLLPYILFEEIE